MDQTRRTRPALIAAGLLLASGLLQTVASLQRWVGAADAWTRTDRLVEDHLFDYYYPATPWEPIGIAAQLLGIGLLLIAAGIVFLAIAARPSSRSGRSSTSFVSPALIALIAAFPFGLLGVHAIASGITRSPSLLSAAWYICTLMSIVGLVALAAVSARHSVAWAIGSIALVGSTLLGYIVSTFSLAPMVAGYQSFDTTPWTETIMAGWPVLAALLILIGVARRAARGRSGSTRSAPHPESVSA